MNLFEDEDDYFKESDSYLHNFLILDKHKIYFCMTYDKVYSTGPLFKLHQINQ